MAVSFTSRLIPRIVNMRIPALAVVRSYSSAKGVRSAQLVSAIFELQAQRTLPAAAMVLRGPSSFRQISTLVKLSDDEVRKRIIDVCKAFDKISADKLKIDSNFMSDLGLDSLDHVELIMAVEDEFGVEISDTDAEKLVTPQEIVKYMTNRLNPKNE